MSVSLSEYDFLLEASKILSCAVGSEDNKECRKVILQAVKLIEKKIKLQNDKLDNDNEGKV